MRVWFVAWLVASLAVVATAGFWRRNPKHYETLDSPEDFDISLILDSKMLKQWGNETRLVVPATNAVAEQRLVSPTPLEFLEPTTRYITLETDATVRNYIRMIHRIMMDELSTYRDQEAVFSTGKGPAASPDDDGDANDSPATVVKPARVGKLPYTGADVATLWQLILEDIVGAFMMNGRHVDYLRVQQYATWQLQRFAKSRELPTPFQLHDLFKERDRLRAQGRLEEPRPKSMDMSLTEEWNLNLWNLFNEARFAKDTTFAVGSEFDDELEVLRASVETARQKFVREAITMYNTYRTLQVGTPQTLEEDSEVIPVKSETSSVDAERSPSQAGTPSPQVDRRPGSQDRTPHSQEDRESDDRESVDETSSARPHRTVRFAEADANQREPESDRESTDSQNDPGESADPSTWRSRWSSRFSSSFGNARPHPPDTDSHRPETTYEKRRRQWAAFRQERAVASQRRAEEKQRRREERASQGGRRLFSFSHKRRSPSPPPSSSPASTLSRHQRVSSRGSRKGQEPRLPSEGSPALTLRSRSRSPSR